MQVIRFNIETDRLILREVRPSDAEGFFELDSNPEVHRFLGNNPVKNIEQCKAVIDFIVRQYQDFGIGRWAVIDKKTDEFVGWAGLKYVTEPSNNRLNFYDLGYRLIERYWGKGFATEAAKASLKYAFETLKLDNVIGTAHVQNDASNKILKKIGFKFIENYYYEDILCNWYELNREEYRILNEK